MKKTLWLTSLLLATALLLIGCTPAKPTATPTPPPPAVTEVPATEAPADEPAAEETGIELTLEELAEYNGKDGKRAYVAVDGIIYDVTDSTPWKNGDHNGYEAGKDLTEAIKTKSPHGIAKLANVKEIGKLVTK